MRSDLLDKIKDPKNSTQLNLSDMQISDDEIDEIISAIRTLKPTITSLDLDRNKLGDEGGKRLSQGLSNLKNLTQLSVQENVIGREGAISLFSLKKAFPDLEILFRGNKITDTREMFEIERLALDSKSIFPR